MDAGFPLGGMDRTENDVSAVEVLNNVFDAFIFDPPIAAITVYQKGLVLALDAANAKLVPYVAAAVDETAIPTAVLGSNVTSDAVPTDVEITAIVGGQVNAALTHTQLAGPGVALSLLDKLRLRQTGIIPQDSTELLIQDN